MKVTRGLYFINRRRPNESDQNIEEAIQCYKKAINQKPVDELPFTRLMVLYRKEKKYEQELKVLNKAIDVRSFYDKKTQRFNRDNKLRQISKALLKNLNKNNKAG